MLKRAVASGGLRRVVTLGLLGLSAFPACNQELPPRSLVNELRVLAIKADPPEVEPGGTSVVSALVTDPEGGGRALDWVITLCTPDLATGSCVELTEILETNPDEEEAAQAFAQCCVRGGNASPSAGVLELGGGFLTSLRTAEGMLEGLDDRAAREGLNAQLTLVACETGICTSGLEDPGDISDPDSIALSLPPDQSAMAVKRIRVSSAPAEDRNENPELEAVLLGDDPFEQGEEAEAAPGQQIELAPLLSEASIQTYTYITTDGQEERRTEAPYFSWYATAGEFEENFTDLTANSGSNLWTAPALESLESPVVTVFVVVWDRRGGIDWIYFDIELEEG